MQSPRISKASMTSHERSLRSRLTQLIQNGGIIRGTLSERAVTCGKTNCKCARGEKHVYLYVIASEHGKYRQRSVPKKLHNDIKTWVDNYRKLQELIEEISQLYWSQVEKRED